MLEGKRKRKTTAENTHTLQREMTCCLVRLTANTKHAHGDFAHAECRMHALTPTTTAAAAPAHPLSSACCLDMHQCRREALALAVRRDNTMDGGMG